MNITLLPQEPVPTLQVKCPHCGSPRIGHVERALVAMQVKTFSRDLFGSLCAVEFQGDPIPDWQTADSVDFEWQCLQCQEEMTEDDLLIEEPTLTES